VVGSFAFSFVLLREDPCDLAAQDQRLFYDMPSTLRLIRSFKENQCPLLSVQDARKILPLLDLLTHYTIQSQMVDHPKDEKGSLPNMDAFLDGYVEMHAMLVNPAANQGIVDYSTAWLFTRAFIFECDGVEVCVQDRMLDFFSDTSFHSQSNCWFGAPFPERCDLQGWSVDPRMGDHAFRNSLSARDNEEQKLAEFKDRRRLKFCLDLSTGCTKEMLHGATQWIVHDNGRSRYVSGKEPLRCSWAEWLPQGWVSVDWQRWNCRYVRE
jgi:hypothetical protein